MATRPTDGPCRLRPSVLAFGGLQQSPARWRGSFGSQAGPVERSTRDQNLQPTRELESGAYEQKVPVLIVLSR
jgi:hypothetical protein